MAAMKLGRCIAVAVEPLPRRPSLHKSSAECGGEGAGGGETCDAGSTEWVRAKAWTEAASVEVKARTTSCNSHSSRRAAFDNDPLASIDVPHGERDGGERSASDDGARDDGERDDGERSKRNGARVTGCFAAGAVGTSQPPRWAIERAISA